MTARLGRLLWALRGALGACMARQPAAVLLLQVVWIQVGRLERLFALAWERHARGLVVVRRRMGVGPAPAEAARRARGARPRSPRGWGWLAHGSAELVAHGNYLRNFLSEPEVAAVLAGAPALRRRFRALLSALGVEDAHAVTSVPKPARRVRPSLDPAEKARRAEARTALRAERKRWLKYRPGPIPSPAEWLARRAALKGL